MAEIRKKRRSLLKTCRNCDQTFMAEDKFYPTNSKYFPDGFLDICEDCVSQMVDARDLGQVDHFCRYADYPFIVDEYTKLLKEHGTDALHQYAMKFNDVNYRGQNWAQFNKKIQDRLARGLLELDVEALRADKLMELKRKWGEKYSPYELEWLENYYIDMHQSYDIQTASHRDYLKKICKLSLLMDKDITNGGDIKKTADAYDKLMKSAEFTQANVKQKGAITSIGELVAILEKDGFAPRYYDHTNEKDAIDLTIKNIQNFNQNLITSDPAIHTMVEALLHRKLHPDEYQDDRQSTIESVYTEKTDDEKAKDNADDLQVDDKNFEDYIPGV